MISQKKIHKLAREVLTTEAEAILKLCGRIDNSFTAACKLIFECKGRVIVTGIGKSGHIAGKLAATLASTGTPSFFMHPSEASHGDIGVITRKDLVIALSNSGNTEELVTILPIIKLLGVPLISITGNPKSTLAKIAKVNLDVTIEKEACPLGLVPTSSTTTTLAMGDALAIALLAIRGFTINDFARSHPGGVLGKRLLLRVDQLMRTKSAIPKVKQHVSLAKALIEVNNKRLGMTTVINNNHSLVGIFTDGDLRRSLNKGLDIHQTKISEVMTKNCKTISTQTLAAEALQIMEQHNITSLVTVDSQNRPVGVVHMHDLLKSGLI